MFSGKTVIITGASSGLGRQLARDLALQGANCVLFGRNEDKLAQTLTLCEEAGAQAITVVGDVTQSADCERLVVESVTRFGGVDIYISNAGLSMWAPFDEVEDLGIFRRLIEVNYLGAVHGAHFALPYLKKSHGQFAAMASIQSKVGVPYHTGYVASKHAVHGLSDTLRQEYAGRGIRVSEILPGMVKTDFATARFSDAEKGDAFYESYGQCLEAEDIARSVLFALEQPPHAVVSQIVIVPDNPG